MAKYILTYYPWITQHKPPDEIRSNVTIFANALQAELTKKIKGITVEVADPMEVPAQITSIAAGKSHIALMNPMGFVFARRKSRRVNAAVLALRMIDGKIGDTYFAQIYTHVDHGIAKLQDLKRKSIGYGSPQSTSNFVIPAVDLKDANIHPFTSFSKMEFVGGHDKVAKAVYEKKIIAGAGHDGVIIDLSRQAGYEDAITKLVQLHRSKPIPSDPIALNVSKSDFPIIQKALVKISKESPAKEAIEIFWGSSKGLKNTNDIRYDGLLSAVKSLGLSETDIFF